MRRWQIAVVLTVGSGAFACAGADVTVKPDAEHLAPEVATIVELPPSLAVGPGPEQRRVQRRAGDTLIALTGGHAVIAEELHGTEDDQVAESLRSLGEDPTRALTFSVVVSRHFRRVASANPIPGFRSLHQNVADYNVRLEVRAIGRSDVIGVVDTVAAADPNGPEIDDGGASVGRQKAVNDALAEGVRVFAPRLFSRVPAAQLVEVPVSVEVGTVARLKALQELYPELSIDNMQLLAASGERFLVLDPGNLSGWGLAAGDLLDAAAGQTLRSRAALARSAARGVAPPLAIERKGARYVLASAGRS